MKHFQVAAVLAFVCAFLPFASDTYARPDRIVLGYVPCRRDAIASPLDFNYDAVTHLARAFIREQDDGSITIPPDYFNDAFETAARKHGVKLLMSIGGGSTEADHWQALAGDPEHVELFLHNVAAVLAEHHYDGVDIDFEPPPQTDTDGRACSDLLKKLRSRFPTIVLTFAITATKNGLAHLPMGDVASSVDFINAMTYSYATPSSGLAGFNGNLHDDPQGAHTRHSVDEGMQVLIETHHVPPAKILLGINFWANRFRVDHLGDKFPAHARGYADNIEYPRVLDLLATGRYKSLRDDNADASYILRPNGGCLVTYEDPVAVKDKCKTAVHLNCAGVMIWNIGADLGGGETPLLSAIAESFGMPRLAISQPALEREIARFSKQPAPAGQTLESLLQIDSRLRSAYAATDDDQWTATAPVGK